MEEETINRIILAIQTQLSPTATQTQRQEAQQVIYQDLDQISPTNRHKIVIIILANFRAKEIGAGDILCYISFAE